MFQKVSHHMRHSYRLKRYVQTLHLHRYTNKEHLQLLKRPFYRFYILTNSLCFLRRLYKLRLLIR